MAKVGIVMGSDSDMPVMSKAAAMLEKLGVDYEMTIISAHREPDVFFEYAKSAEEKGFKVIIAGAGMGCPSAGYVCCYFPRCRLSVSRCIPLLWEAEIPCTRSYRCRPVSRWQPWQSTEEPMQRFSQRRFLQHLTMRCSPA